MDKKTEISRQTVFAALSISKAGIVSIILIPFFIDMLTWLFIPVFMIMVFISAFFTFRRQMHDYREFNGKRNTGMAFEIGTVTHFYTFA